MEEYYVMELRDRGIGLAFRTTDKFPEEDEIRDFLREYGGNTCSVRVYKEYRLLPFA